MKTLTIVSLYILAGMLYAIWTFVRACDWDDLKEKVEEVKPVLGQTIPFVIVLVFSIIFSMAWPYFLPQRIYHIYKEFKGK